MIASTIWKNLISTLKNNPTLSQYINNVFECRRFNIEPDSLPCIMLEPVKDGEIAKDYNQIQDLYFNVDLYAFSSSNVQEFKKSIAGDSDYKGILDIENDIRACLSSSYSLGDTVIDIKIEPVVFDELDLGKYPVRGLLMPLKILYRQTDGY
jgi:hypothetical protein